MEDIFVYLYPLLSFSCAVSYLPQIKALILARKAPSSFAYLTWVIWFFESIICVGYGMFHLKDFLFCLLSVLEFVFIGVVLALAYFNEYARFRIKKTVRIRNLKDKFAIYSLNKIIP